MNDPLHDRLCETVWRRPLTPDEEAELRGWLAAHPDREPDWEAEASLGELLNRLTDAEVSSNFTARVLSRVDALDHISPPSRNLLPRPAWTWRRLIPKAAFVAAIVGVTFLSYQRHEQTVQRAELARSLAMVSGVATVPGPDALRNFEVIQRLDQTPRPDDQLLELLK